MDRITVAEYLDSLNPVDREDIGKAYRSLFTAFTFSDHPINDEFPDFWHYVVDMLSAMADNDIDDFEYAYNGLVKSEKAAKVVEPDANWNLSQWRDWARKSGDVLAEAAAKQPPMSAARKILASLSVDAEGMAYGLKRDAVEKGVF